MASNEKKLTYEEAVTQLEETVKQLEDGKLPLEKSLALFEKGAKLAAFCNECLETAEKKIDRLTKVEEDVATEQISAEESDEF